MKLNNLQLGDEIKYTYKNETYVGKIVKHNKTVCSDLVNDKNIIIHESNKYHIMLYNTNSIISFDDNNKDMSIIDIKRKEAFLI